MYRIKSSTLTPFLLSAILLLPGCGQEDPDSATVIETNGQTAAADDTGETGAQGVISPADDIFTVERTGITLIGNGLSRNGILNQLVEFDEAELHGGPLIDQPVDIRVERGSMGEVLGQLLTGVSYQVRLERQEGARERLHSLWLGEEAMRPQVVLRQVDTDGAAGLVSPLETMDGSVDAGEDHVTMLYRQYTSGGAEARKMAIMDVELTEGGVAFLDHVMKSAQDEEILIEAIRRLEIGEEFGAKWALLEALGHPNATIVHEVLESIEVWRDPTIRKYVLPLTFHENNEVREKALELVDDLDTYADVGVAADPYDIEAATRTPVSAEQRQQKQAAKKIQQQNLREKAEKMRNRSNQ
jgi:hypothetical protein